MGEQLKTSRLSSFLAILYYEFLWNIRKKKIVGLFILVFLIVTLELGLPPLLDYYNHMAITPDSTIVTEFFNGFSGIFLFLIAVATTMNTISGEFETGSITPLLTKPISKNMVFWGKIVASFLTLVAIYSFLAAYTVAGAFVIEGSQSNLQLVPLGLVGLTLATLVWASVVILLGTITKSSLIAALGSFGIYIGITIAGFAIASALGQTTVLFYAPGTGATGSTQGCSGGTAFATGTDNLGYLLIQSALNPNTVLNFCGVRISPAGMGKGEGRTLFVSSTGTFASLALQDLWVTAVYLTTLLLISWYAFKRSQIIESA